MIRKSICYPRKSIPDIENPYGYVYAITNLLNGKQYVGQHQGKQFDSRYWGSGIEISRAIREYGCDNFTREVLDWAHNKQELSEKEIYWISVLDTFQGYGYNLSPGGDGVTWTPEARKKLSESFSGENNPNYGIGVIWTPEARANASKAASKRIGEKNSFYGHHHTEDWKEKYRYGKNNPRAKAVYQYTLEGQYIQHFDTVKAAADAGFAGASERCKLKVHGNFRNARVPFKGFLWSFLPPDGNHLPPITLEPYYKSQCQT